MVQISTNELVRALCSFYTQILTPGGQRERSEIIFLSFAVTCVIIYFTFVLQIRLIDVNCGLK